MHGQYLKHIKIINHIYVQYILYIYIYIKPLQPKKITEPKHLSGFLNWGLGLGNSLWFRFRLWRWYPGIWSTTWCRLWGTWSITWCRRGSFGFQKGRGLEVHRHHVQRLLPQQWSGVCLYILDISLYIYILCKCMLPSVVS